MEFLGVPGQGQGVQVDDAIEGIVLVLEVNPMLEGAEVVAEMGVAGRLDAAEDPLPIRKVLVQG